MTYVMPFGDPYDPDVYDIARRMSPRECDSWVPMAVEIPDSMGPRINRYHVEEPRTLGTYCIRCQRRSTVTVYARKLVTIPSVTIDQLMDILPCDHFSAWEITPWLLNKAHSRYFGRRDNYVHLVYCRTCRKVYKTVLPYDLAVRKGE